MVSKTIFHENIANTYISTMKTHVKVWKIKSKGNKKFEAHCIPKKVIHHVKRNVQIWKWRIIKHDHGYNTHLVSIGIEVSLKNHKLNVIAIIWHHNKIKSNGQSKRPLVSKNYFSWTHCKNKYIQIYQENTYKGMEDEIQRK